MIEWLFQRVGCHSCLTRSSRHHRAVDDVAAAAVENTLPVDSTWRFEKRWMNTALLVVSVKCSGEGRGRSPRTALPRVEALKRAVQRWRLCAWREFVRSDYGGSAAGCIHTWRDRRPSRLFDRR